MLVLRDVEEEGHFEALEKAARANMETLWRDVHKPSRYVVMCMQERPYSWTSVVQ